MSIMETARLYQVTPGAVRHANTKHKLGFPVTGRKRPKRDLTAMRERVEALAAQGKTQMLASLALQVPFNTVKRWSRAWGVQWRKRGGKKAYADRLRPHVTQSQMDDITFLRRKSFTYREAVIAIRRPDLLEFLP
jgi:hypothetical protein